MTDKISRQDQHSAMKPNGSLERVLFGYQGSCAFAVYFNCPHRRLRRNRLYNLVGLRSIATPDRDRKASRRSELLKKYG
jgi:hypothetical protein